MQTYNSFNEMAAANGAAPLVSDMSVFNVEYGSEEELRKIIEKYTSDEDYGKLKNAIIKSGKHFSAEMLERVAGLDSTDAATLWKFYR